MYFLTNKGKCVICLGAKDIIPGGDPVEVTENELDHPLIEAHVKAGDLELTEVDEVEGVKEDGTADTAETVKTVDDSKKTGK